MVRAAVTMPTHASTGHPLRGDDRTRGGGGCDVSVSHCSFAKKGKPSIQTPALIDHVPKCERSPTSQFYVLS